MSQGHDFTVHYGIEDSFNSPPAAGGTPFGSNATLNQAQGSNEAARVFEPANRVPIEIVERVFSGSWGVEFSFNTGHLGWVELLLGTDGNGGYTSTVEPSSAAIAIGRTESGSTRVLSGCVATSCSIDSSVNNEITVSISGAYADEELITPGTGGIASQPELTGETATFADAALSFGGTTLGYVQNATVNIESNVNLINELGTRFAVDFSPKQLEPSVQFSKINEQGGTSQLEDMYGGGTSIQENVTSDTAMNLAISDETGSTVMSVDLSGTFPESYGESGLGNPEEDVTEQINRMTTNVAIA